MSQIEREGSDGQQPDLPLVLPLFSIHKIPSLVRTLRGERGPKSYQGPLETFFNSEPPQPVRAEIRLGESQFITYIGSFRGHEPGEESFRMVFRDPDTHQRVFLDLSPRRIEISKVREVDNKTRNEAPVLSMAIYGDWSLLSLKDKALMRQVRLDWSIFDAKAVPDWLVSLALGELDYRRAPKPKGDELVKLEPRSLAAQEIMGIIGEGLGLLRSEQPR